MNIVDIKSLNENFVKSIGEDWMLISCGTPEHFNMMTASWGGIGYLWNRAVVYIFVRPERYTHTLIDQHNRFSLTFFDEKYRDALTLCGKVSGRDVDKSTQSGLTPLFTEHGTPYFKESRLMLECRKFYSVEIKDGEFKEQFIPETWYKKEGVHTMYIAEIEQCLVEKQ